jgi:nuclear pore complex protein Nup188
MSSFGTSQANREVWELEPECQRLISRIRDLTLVIAIEAMSLATILTPSGDPPAPGTLLTSRDALFNTHVFILEQSEDLTQQSPEPGQSDFPVWPMAVICLGWAIALRSLSQELAPPAPGYDGNAYQEMAKRALRLPSGLFPWLEDVLTGPLFQERELAFDDPTNDPATHRRKVVKGMP